MKLAVLTDIHGNREAFEAVLADARARGAGRFVILGDLVGYGPDPGWCVDKARDLMAAGAICLRGNHDSAAGGAVESMSSLARAAMDWTIRQLDDDQRRSLAALPLTAMLDDVLFVHASADDPAAWNYVTSDARAVGSFRATTARIILCGHVHVPLLVSCDPAGQVRGQGFRMGLPVPLIRSRRWLAVVGSAGQPRDGVAQPGYAMMDLARDELTFHRVPCDMGLPAARIRAAGLPEPLAARLIRGT